MSEITTPEFIEFLRCQKRASEALQALQNAFDRLTQTAAEMGEALAKKEAKKEVSF